MRDHTIPLHLTESKTSISGSTLGWLSCEDLSGSSTSGMHLVTDHMLQSLIVSWTKEDEHLLLFTSKSIVHHFVTISLVSQVMEFISNR